MKKQAEEAKAKFAHDEGDHLTLLNVYHAYKAGEYLFSFEVNLNYLNHINLKFFHVIMLMIIRIR